jgi:hypothetical protein
MNPRVAPSDQTILALAALPVPALAREPWHGGRQDFHGDHGRFEGRGRLFIGVYAFPSYAYVPPACYWQAGYWVNQPYVDAWGRYVYVQQWVPAQWICP